MILKKWNYKKHIYEDYEVPDDWNYKTYSDNMYEIVNCPHCGGRLLYGEGYTSMQIHTGLGLGFCVCEECYQKKMERRFCKKYDDVSKID